MHSTETHRWEPRSWPTASPQRSGIDGRDRRDGRAYPSTVRPTPKEGEEWPVVLP